MVHFWQALSKPFLALAPMAGVTDLAFRTMCKRFGANVIYTEFASANALVHGNEATRRMIQFRLQEAGYRSALTLFTDDAIEKVYDYSEGYPRRIAMLCHRALRALVMRRERVIHGEMVEELIQEELEAGWSQPKRLQKSSSSV